MSTTLPMTGEDPVGDLVKLMQQWFDDGMSASMIAARLRDEGNMYKAAGDRETEAEVAYQLANTVQQTGRLP